MGKRVAKPKKIPKNVTLDDLARMMADGFTEVGHGFSGVHDRVDELDERLSGQIENLDEHLSGQLGVLDQKITAVNANVLSLSYDNKKIVNRLENVELRAFGSIQE
ncbi:MAG: hypothetical protein Q7R90_03260 [bacterium]|nr:hypothetical protein [bacterium]